MKVIVKEEYGDGAQLWFGVPTWDPAGRSGEMSVKYAYRAKGGGRWARTSPEVPESVVLDMLVMLNRQGRLLAVLRNAARLPALRDEVKGLITTLERVLKEVR